MSIVGRIHSDKSLSIKGKVFNDWEVYDDADEIDSERELDLDYEAPNEVPLLFNYLFGIENNYENVDFIKVDKFGNLMVKDIIDNVSGFDELDEVDTNKDLNVGTEFNDNQDFDDFLKFMYGISSDDISPNRFKILNDNRIMARNINEEVEL